MVNVRLYNFDKRKNSTKRPNTSGGDLVQGEVKQDFTPLAPVITFNLPDPTAVPTYNYAYIAEFGQRFYFITDWLFVSGLWRATMAVDVLATYQSTIFASQQYVARSKGYPNHNIIDGSYNTLAGASFNSQELAQSALWGADYGQGCFIMSTISYSGANVGAVTYYAMSWLCAQKFFQDLLSSPNWMNISASEISEDLQKALINPLQYVVSCIWIPARWETFIYYNSPTFDGDLSKNIKLGWWSFDLPTGEGTGEYTVRRLHNPTFGTQQGGTPDRISANFTFTIPKHPQAATRGAWLNMAPTSKYTLTYLPFGVFDIDTTDIKNATFIRGVVTMHAYTGDATLQLFVVDGNNNSQCILTTETNLAIQIPVGQIAMNLGNLDNALLAGAAAGVSEVASMYSAHASAAASQTSGRMGGTTVSGSHGGSHKSGKF